MTVAAEEKPTITPEGTPTEVEDKSASLFFDGKGEHAKVLPEGSAEPEGASDAGEKGTEEIVPGEEAKDDPTKWFIPGKYKTQEDAIKNQENRMGGIAQQLSEISKKLDTKPTAPTNGGEAKPTTEVNPETGKPFSQQEIMGQWNEYFQSNPVEAQIAWDKMMGERMTGEITSKVIRNLTWSAFLSANPEMNSAEKVLEVQTILQNFPFLNGKPDALIRAKEISLAQGDNLEDKYNSWLLSKKGEAKPNGPAGREVPPQMPGQPAVNKGGPGGGNKDPFFDTKSGSSIFNYRG